MCAYLDEDSRRQLGTLFHEHVTDVATRQRLRDAWGLCNWHTWTAVEIRAAATGLAILAEDLLRVGHHRIEAHGDRRPGRVTRLRAWLRGLVGWAAARRPAGTVAAYRARPRCMLCAQLRGTEAQCLDAVLRFADDPQFDRAYARSSGLCLPHLLAAMERGSGTPGLETIVQRTLAKWQALRADLARFVAKHEYRNAERVTEAESRSYHVALEILAGRRNVFGNDMRRD